MDISNFKYKFIKFDLERQVARIGLNDPKTHNSLNREMQLEIKDALKR